MSGVNTVLSYTGPVLEFTRGSQRATCEEIPWLGFKRDQDNSSALSSSTASKSRSYS